MKAHVFVMIVMSTSVGAFSQPADPNSPLTVEDYLHIAAENNAGLKSSFHRWRMAAAQVPQAKALDDPRFTYGYFIEEVETRTGPQKQRFSISQMFPWFGKIEARTDTAAANAQAAYKRYEADKLKLFGKVKGAFYEYVYLYEAIDIARQNLELLKHFEQVAQARYRTAAAQHPDIIRAQIELALMEDNLTGLENMLLPVTSGLNALLNRDMTVPLDKPRRHSAALVDVDEAVIVGLIAERNPEIAALQKDIAAARSRIRLAQKRYAPDVTLGVDWIQTDDARMDGVWGSGRDPIVAMVSVNIPLWTDSYDAGKAQAQSAMRATRRNKEQMQLDLSAQAANVLYQIAETGRKATLYEGTLIPKAREMVDVSESSYRAGGVDFLNLIDAQRKLLTFEVTYQRILTDHFQAMAQLETLTGGAVPLK
ncbi:MAG: TolC family protein [Planctomycetota bacterium]|jgi:outer membrane protein TolC